ncbi:MAG: PD40 domain-containing protein [Pyrinomonadaceae bacterium]|nr:PD40 domain-containing protein [Pyrinomonadaceae bacterium]
MKSATHSGARHRGRTMLALVVFVTLLASPGYSLPARQADAAAKTQAVSARRQSAAQDDVQPANHTPVQRGRIAFASDRDGDFEIYVIDPDGGNLMRLTDNEADDISPTWSPDGERLAFVSYRDGNAEIYATDADGGAQQTRLTDNPAADLDPAWSPDGARLAFTSGRDNTDEIYVMGADGSNPTNLTNNREGDDVQPAWSPDGAMLAFASNRDENYEIYAMAADGGNQRNLSNNTATDANPAWSPMRITFQSDRDSPPNMPETNFEIYALNGADGGNQTRLTAIADDPATPLDESFDVQPARSSDGARIAFASTRDGDFEIYAVGADGSAPTKLTDNDEANDIEPAVQPLETAAGGSLQFSAATLSVDEGAGSLTVTVTRTGVTTGLAQVDFAAESGTASGRSDFLATAGTLSFVAGETSQTFTVFITDDAFVELDETFTLTLGSATGAALGSVNTITATIRDNDTVQAAANPIDNSEFFVRQHYRDFLNRDPEPAGLAAWLAVLNRCNGGFTENPDCDRISVSASFFLSPEFRGEGYFSIRFYLAALGRLPTYAEFIRDLASLNGMTAAEVATNRTNFTRAFLAREEFRTRYDRLTNADFVDTLARTAGVTLANRDQLVIDLDAGRTTRVQVLRDVVDSTQFAGRRDVFNMAFVLSQYFGYLRRDPEPEGFAAWLRVLNENPNNFRIMVNGFVNSVEYRMRFGRP